MTEQIWKRYLPDQKVMQALAFEAGKFVPFQSQWSLGPGTTTVYSVTGAGLLDLAVASGSSSSNGASMKIVVDGVVMVQTPMTTSYAVGVLTEGAWALANGSTPSTLMRANGSYPIVMPSGTYVPGLSTSAQGVLFINRPIKFNKSLEIIVGMGADGYYRIQGGLFL